MKKRLLIMMTLLVAIAAGAWAQTYNGHGYVDLGLPSGTLWATCNVGATAPEQYGDYFAWGETTPKSEYTWSTYKWGTSESALTKYTASDSKTVLELEDDAANVNWGYGWRMPTGEEFQELLDNTTSETTTLNGVSGRKFTSMTNGNSIFLPTPGLYTSLGDFILKGQRGNYMSSQVYTTRNAYFLAYLLAVDVVDGITWTSNHRCAGQSVRAVISKSDVPPGIAIDETNFPDANFRAAVASTDYDKDGDGYLTDAEIASVRSINVSGMEIEDLTGIEYFTSTWYLNVSNNKLSQLDLSKNTNLRKIWCENNQLPSLDLTQNTHLYAIVCYANQMTGDNMTSLVGGLVDAPDEDSPSEAPALRLPRRVWSDLIGRLIAVDLTDANDGNQILVEQVEAARAKGWQVYDNNGGNPKVYDGLAIGLAIDETNFPDAKFRVVVAEEDTNHDGILSDEEIAAVTDINVQGKQIADLTGIEHFTALKDLYCDRNQLTTLNLIHNTALELLFCSNNQLTSLTLPQNTELYYLRCDENQLTSLDVSKNVGLQMLLCNNNALTTLDVSKNTELQWLSCDYNQLTALDLSQNAKLAALSCVHNQLAQLTVAANGDLYDIYSYWNLLKGDAVDALIASLPQVYNKRWYFYNPHDTDQSNVAAPRRASRRANATQEEGNEMTTAQVAAAKSKGWTPYYFTGTSWQAYEGVTAITATTADGTSSAAPRYNLQGQRVGADYKGIVIENGHKVVKR